MEASGIVASNKFILHYSKFRFDDKPLGFDKRTQQFSQYYTANVSIQDMADVIADGRCWRNARFDLSKRRFLQKYALGSRFISLDLDGSIYEPEEIIEYAWSQGIGPNIFYYSFSQGIKPGNNFRLVWILDRELGPQEWEVYNQEIYQLFKKFDIDQNTKNLDRMWYGGRSSEVINAALVPVENLPAPKMESIKVDEQVLDCGNGFSEGEIKAHDWEGVLDKYSIVWRKFKNGDYLRRNERLVLFGNLRLLDGAFNRVIELIDWEVYESKNSSFSISQLKYWWEDETLKPARIIRNEGIGYSVSEWYEDKLF